MKPRSDTTIAEKCHDGGRELSHRACHVIEMPSGSFDRTFWRAQAQNNILRGLTALEEGGIPFGDWERLHLSAAIDEFRSGHYEGAAEYAQRIMNREANRQPFVGHFPQDKSLADFRDEFQKLIAQAC
jgi:hypothetical protein